MYAHVLIFPFYSSLKPIVLSANAKTFFFYSQKKISPRNLAIKTAKYTQLTDAALEAKTTEGFILYFLQHTFIQSSKFCGCVFSHYFVSYRNL